MRFTLDQHFGAEPAQVVAAYTDPALYPTLTRLSKVATPELLTCEREGHEVRLELRMRFTAPLSAAARAVVDPDKISWVQEERYDLRTLQAHVVFRPDNYAARFSCQGGYTFVEDPSRPGAGCVRQVTGDLRIRMPLVGGQVERAMVSGLREHFTEEQPLVQHWLDQG